jgi:hypothetical protein
MNLPLSSLLLLLLPLGALSHAAECGMDPQEVASPHYSPRAVTAPHPTTTPPQDSAPPVTVTGKLLGHAPRLALLSTPPGVHELAFPPHLQPQAAAWLHSGRVVTVTGRVRAGGTPGKAPVLDVHEYHLVQPSDRGQSPREHPDRGQSPREHPDRGQSPREHPDRVKLSQVTTMTSVTFLISACGKSPDLGAAAFSAAWNGAANTTMEQYVTQCSYGQLAFPAAQNVVADVTGTPMPCSGTSAVTGLAYDLATSCGYPELLALQEWGQQASGLDMAQFTRRVVVLPAGTDGLGVGGPCGWYGMGSQGCAGSYCDAWVRGDRADYLNTFFHELGHTMHAVHAATPAWTYGDCSDAMGCSARGACYNAPNSWRVGWTTPLATFTTGNLPAAGAWTPAYTLPPHLAGPTGNHIQVRSQASPEQALFLSYRTATGWDAGLGAPYAGSVSVHRYNGTLQGDDAEYSTVITQLADSLGPPGNSLGAPNYSLSLQKSSLGTAPTSLASSQSYPDFGVVVQVLSVAPAGAQVRVCRFLAAPGECSPAPSPAPPSPSPAPTPPAPSPSPAPAPTCADTDQASCVVWKAHGFCAQPAYAAMCRATCGLCTPIPPAACGDIDTPSCLLWKAHGFCAQPAYAAMCRATCGLCVVGTPAFGSGA